MKAYRTFVTAAALAALSVLTASTANAQDCQPGIGPAYAARAATFQSLINAIVPGLGNVTTGLASLADQATYQTLLTDSRAVANSVANGRLVIAVPDGTVVLDTARSDDPTNVLAVGNSYAHFVAKTVNENHNSRVAILAAQEYPCGVGIESKLSTTTGQVETYLAIRIGGHLDSLGTARISTRQ